MTTLKRYDYARVLLGRFATDHEMLLRPEGVWVRWADVCASLDALCDCAASGHADKPKQHGADPHAKNCQVYGGEQGRG
jgi:hypothetical protein